MAVIYKNSGQFFPKKRIKAQIESGRITEEISLLLEQELVPFPFSFEWLVHHKPGEVCSGLCLHQTTIQWQFVQISRQISIVWQWEF
ncbi:hypothetical protein [Vibrio navarrensis]|uniref:hypothetical protein n=1 Tax=Vibrio navarrensis TaxID=29495 RepID=UPI0013027438|nr:hypothetical protein [Vibrio navarrensis]